MIHADAGGIVRGIDDRELYLLFLMSTMSRRVYSMFRTLDLCQVQSVGFACLASQRELQTPAGIAH